MKRSLIASLAVVFLVLTAVPASAKLNGRFCDTYNGPSNHSVKVCISVNQHDAVKDLQGLLEFFNVPGKSAVECLWVDHVSLYNNGALNDIRYGDPGCVYAPDGPEEQAHTAWVNCHGNHQYMASSLVKIRWFAGNSSTWKGDTSNFWTPTDTDCFTI